MPDNVSSNSENTSNSENIDNLYINIDVSTGKSEGNIVKFIKSLDSLKSSLTEISGMIDKLNALDFGKIAKQLKDVRSISGSISKTQTAKNQQTTSNENKYNIIDRSGAAPSDAKRISELDNRVGYMDPTQLRYQNEIAKRAREEIEKSADAADDLDKSIAEINASYEDLVKNARVFLQSSSQDRKGRNIDTYGFVTESGDTGTIKKINDEVDSIRVKTKEAAEQARRFESIWKSAGHVLKYRAISAVITMISKGLTEGIKNVALFDDSFNSTMSDIITQYNTLTNQIGSAASELIKMVAPIATQVLSAFTYVTNGLSQLFALLNGETQYNKAVDNAYDFAKNLRKAYTGIGIDELNILNQSEEQGALFEKADVNAGDIFGSLATIGGISAAFLTIKSAINSTNTKGLSGLIEGLSGLFKKNNKSGFTSAIETLTSSGTASKISKVTSAIGKFAAGAASLAASFSLSSSAGKNFADIIAGDGEGSVAGSLLSLVGGVGTGVLGGAMIGGPIGAVAGGVASLVTSLVSYQNQAAQIAQDKSIEKYFGDIGVSIDSAKSQLAELYEEIVDFDLTEYYSKLDELSQNNIDSANTLKDIFDKLSGRDELTTQDVENLKIAFDDLAESAKSVNNLRLDMFQTTLQQALGSIPEDKIAGMTGLFDSVSNAIQSMNDEIEQAKIEFEALISDGLNASELERASELARKINENTISEETNALYGAIRAFSEGINLGSSEEEIRNSISELKAQADEYIKSSQSQYDAWLDTAYYLKAIGRITDEEYSAYQQVAEEAQKATAEEINSTLASAIAATTDAYLKEISEEYAEQTGKSAQELYDLLYEDRKNFGKNWLTVGHTNEFADIRDAFGFYGALGIYDVLDILTEEYAGLEGITQENAVNSLFNDYSKTLETIQQYQSDSLPMFESMRDSLENLSLAASAGFVINITDEQISEAQSRYNARRGVTVATGGYGNAD